MMKFNNIRVIVQYDRLKLLEVLKKNLATHREFYEEALEGFKVVAKQKLEEQLSFLAAGSTANVVVNLMRPESYIEVYESIISMLEASEDKTVGLNADEFRQLWLDKWDWTKGWMFSNSAYSDKIRRATYGD